MPRRDLISLDGNENYGLNVFDTVGLGGANRPGDVMVVQAMFRFLHDVHIEQEYPYPSMEGKDIEPNGIVGNRTIQAITNYQRRNSTWVLSTDGVVHPAKYENRKITSGLGKRVMTITYLHLEVWLADNTLDYTREIARRFPNVAFWIGIR